MLACDSVFKELLCWCCKISKFSEGVSDVIKSAVVLSEFCCKLADVFRLEFVAEPCFAAFFSCSKVAFWR